MRKKLAGKTTKLDRLETNQERPSLGLMEIENGTFFNAEISRIAPDPKQPRKYFDSDSLAELSKSIKAKGVLQPVVIRQGSDGSFLLVAGERRYRAAKMAGLESIPCIYTTGDPEEIALIENLQREDLNPIEEAEGLASLMTSHKYTQEQLAEVIGKARTTITRSLSLNKLPKEIKEECARAHIYPKRLLVEIAKQDTEAAMLALFEQIKTNNLKSAEVRKITRKRAQTTEKSLAEQALGKIGSFAKALAKIDFAALEEEERALIKEELETLKRAIDKIMGS
ncbi:MAG: ParB/RepB/Spo0J family partition protein [Dehalococcoidia bacterium]|nr:ParB/RepB/Spo0J family partition protein [Dehalococcoidia bacterium]